MAKKKYEESNIQAIATAIREKTGTEKTYKVSEMDEGVNEVYEAGKQAQHLKWWGKYLNNGLVKSATGAFYGYRWTDDTFDPPFDINASNSSVLFGLTQIKDVRGILARNRVNLIFNDSLPGYNQHFTVFANSAVVYLPYLKLPSTSSAYGWFSGCTNLKEVDGYECLERHAFESGTGTANKTFYNCINLEHIIFHGTIANSINLQWSTKLDLESLISLLTCLFNYDSSGEQWSKTITLSSESWALLEAQGAVATSPVTGEACTWIQYVDAKCWNRT